ncbi:MAG TPA: restriction endonuclease subunit S [Polyangia bacterium]|nr:restriction endonuclease subunit S [Polyangia bacterium]
MHWNVGSIKREILSIESGTSVNAFDEPATAGQPAVLKTSCVYAGDFDPNENKTVVPEEAGRVSCPVKANTLIVSRMNTPDLVGAAGLVRSAPAHLFLPDRLWQVSFRSASAAFVHYWTLTGGYRAQVEAACTGTSASMKNLAQDQFGQFQVALPPIDEQLGIAAFLDRETAKIDALVGEQERLIELLKEKRQAVISHAVTKGLNPSAPMKDSGLGGIGVVPIEWVLHKLKHLTSQLTVGIVVEPSRYYADNGIPALRSLNVRPGAVSLENLVFISEEAHQMHAKSRLNAGDLVAVRSGQPGTATVIPAELEGCNCVDLIIIRRPTGMSAAYLCWYLASEAAKVQFSEGSGGAIQQHFNVSAAGELIVPVPSRQEQDAIVAYLDRMTSRLDGLVREVERAIALLQERRTALISAAVTGQIDVRETAERSAA